MGAIELGCRYILTNPPNTDYFCLNDPSDPNFVGYVTDITGLDDAGVRENAQVVVAGDGGYHGPFWRDRRPWTMSGIIWPTLPVLARDLAQERMQGILGQCMQADGGMYWTPADGEERMVTFRKQQSVRIAKGQSNVEKTFQIACVNADYRIMASSQQTQSKYGGNIDSNNRWSTDPSGTGTLWTWNSGNTTAGVYFQIDGPINGFTLNNITTGKIFVCHTSVYPGGVLYVNLLNQYPTVSDDAGNIFYGDIDPVYTNWDIGVIPGNNAWSLVEWYPQGPDAWANSASTALHVSWSDSWV